MRSSTFYDEPFKCEAVPQKKTKNGCAQMLLFWADWALRGDVNHARFTQKQIVRLFHSVLLHTHQAHTSRSGAYKSPNNATFALNVFVMWAIIFHNGRLSVLWRRMMVVTGRQHLTPSPPIISTVALNVAQHRTLAGKRGNCTMDGGWSGVDARQTRGDTQGIHTPNSHGHAVGPA